MSNAKRNRMMVAKMSKIEQAAWFVEIYIKQMSRKAAIEAVAFKFDLTDEEKASL